MSDAPELPPPNHEEGCEWALFHQGDSNLARCYLALLAEIERLKAEIEEAGRHSLEQFRAAKASVREVNDLRAQLEAAREDAERLSWLDDQWTDGVHVEVCAANNGKGGDALGRHATVFIGTAKHCLWCVRAAIDAARAEKPLPSTFDTSYRMERL